MQSETDARTASLRVMLIDQRAERQELLAAHLAGEGCELVACLHPGDDIPAAVARHRPDVVLIELDSPSRDTLESLRSIRRPLVMFSGDDQAETIRRAVEAGVSTYIVDGLENRRVRPIVEVAMARFAQFEAMERELAEARNALRERKTIERAKGILIAQQGFTEQTAYSAMRRLAMDRNRRIVDIAEAIVTADELARTAGARQ